MQSSERGNFEKSSKKDCGESGGSLLQHPIVASTRCFRELQEPLKWGLNHSSADQGPVKEEGKETRVFLYTPVSEQTATT